MVSRCRQSLMRRASGRNRIEESQGRSKLGETASSLVMNPAELVEAKKGLLDVGRRHQIEPPFGRVDDLAGVRLALGDGMEHVEEALVREVVRTRIT